MPSPEAEAIERVRRRAAERRDAATARLLLLAERGDTTVESLLHAIRDRAPITLNFHPDRPLADGRTVAQHLLASGRYENQFVTGISNGSRTAFPGGERDVWERDLFGGAYHGPGVRGEDRPKYGGLNVMHHADGACPRFGSCYFELRPEVLARSTFTWGDSHLGPVHVGTADAFEPILAALVESVASAGEALGATGLNIGALVTGLTKDPPAGAPARRAHGRALDAYIEVQVHGDLVLARDAVALVAEPAFEGTATGEELRELCRRHGVGLRAHAGFAMSADEVPSDFRGPRMPALALRVVEHFGGDRATLDASVIGRAAQSLHHAPDAWSDWGTQAETLQHIKQLWHVLVRYGRPRE